MATSKSTQKAKASSRTPNLSSRHLSSPLSLFYPSAELKRNVVIVKNISPLLVFSVIDLLSFERPELVTIS